MGSKIEYLNGLGLVSKTKKQVKSLQKYAHLIPQVSNTNSIIHKDGSVFDTVAWCKKIVRSTLNDTKKLAPLFKKSELQYTLFEVFEFVYNHIKYEEDARNIEQLRRPARTLRDGKGDCDCMSILVSSILTNLNIPHDFRIVKMYGRDWYQHIYVIVPIGGRKDMTKRENYYVIDCVLDKFNTEAPKINEKKDFHMENLSGIPIQLLNGTLEVPRLGKEFDDIEGLSGTDEQIGRAFNHRMKAHLVNRYNDIQQNPGKVSHVYNARALAAAYKELIGAWDSEAAREGALDRLSANEESFLRPEFQGLGDILEGEDTEIFGLLNVNGIHGSLGDISSLGKVAIRKKVTGSDKATVKRGPITKIKQATKVVKAAGKKGGGAVKKVASKAGRLVVKSTTTPIRLGILAAMKVNFGRLACRAYWGLFPKSEAMSHGVTSGYWDASNKVWNNLRNTFVNKLKGDEKALRQSIITGRAAKIAKRGTHGLGFVVTAATAASITAASAVLVPIIKMASTATKGQRLTANSAPDDGGEQDNEDIADNTQELVDAVTDNYTNEVVDEQPVEGYIEGIGKVIKKKAPAPVKSKPKTETAKRVTKEKNAKKSSPIIKKVIKAANPVTHIKKTAQVAKKVIAKKQVQNATKIKKAPLKTLVSKLKSHPKMKGKSDAEIIKIAQDLQNKPMDTIVNEANNYAEKEVTKMTNSGGGKNITEDNGGPDSRNTPNSPSGGGETYSEPTKRSNSSSFVEESSFDKSDSASVDKPVKTDSTNTNTNTESTDDGGATAETKSGGSNTALYVGGFILLIAGGLALSKRGKNKEKKNLGDVDGPRKKTKVTSNLLGVKKGSKVRVMKIK